MSYTPRHLLRRPPKRRSPGPALLGIIGLTALGPAIALTIMTILLTR